MSSPESCPLGLIGLGLLGSAAVQRLGSAGFRVMGYDIASTPRNEHARRGQLLASGPLEIARTCQTTLLVLPDSGCSLDVLGQMVDGLSTDSLVIDLTTGSPDDTVRLQELCAASGCCYTDVTVAGSSHQLQQGEATLLIGAAETDEFPGDLRSVLDSLSNQQFWLGSVGAAARMKLVVNLVLGLNRLVLAEGLAFAESLGIAATDCLEVLSSGPASSRVMQTKGQKMIDRHYSPVARLGQHLKDVRLILEQADSRDVQLPLTGLHQGILEELVSHGWGDADNSSVREYFRSGLDIDFPKSN